MRDLGSSLARPGMLLRAVAAILLLAAPVPAQDPPAPIDRKSVV